MIFTRFLVVLRIFRIVFTVSASHFTNLMVNKIYSQYLVHFIDLLTLDILLGLTARHFGSHDTIIR